MAPLEWHVLAFDEKGCYCWLILLIFFKWLKENYIIGLARKQNAGSISTSCNPPYTQTDKPVEVRDRSAIWVTGEKWKTDYKLCIASTPKKKWTKRSSISHQIWSFRQKYSKERFLLSSPWDRVSFVWICDLHQFCNVHLFAKKIMNS
jgi:hypothetical protein